MKLLKQFGIIPFTTGAVKLLLGNYKSPNDKIAGLMASGDLIQLKKGLYVISNDYRNQKISKEIIANLLYGPSYVSLDFALSFYGIIPERVVLITSITSKRSKKFNTVFGDFIYVQAPIDYYQIGITQAPVDTRYNFLIATPEKALCDKIVFTKKLNLNSLQSMRDFLLDDLRADFQQLKQMNLSIIEECTKAGQKQKELELLIKTIKKFE